MDCLSNRSAVDTHNPFPRFERMGFQDAANVISSLVIPLIFLAAMALAAYYVTNPVMPLIQLLPHFTLSVPVVTTLSTGALCLLTVPLQLVRRNKIKNSYQKIPAQIVKSSSNVRKLLRSAVHLGGRTHHDESEEEPLEGKIPKGRVKKKPLLSQQAFGLRSALMQGGFKAVTFTTRDDLNLTGYWKQIDDNPDRSTVIIFHGNGRTAELKYQLADFYSNLGMNVLIPEYRGYGLSPGKSGGQKQEIEAYYDAEAAYQFVLDQGMEREKVIAHGYSIGGTYASALGYFFDLPSIILSHTFTSLHEVMNNISKILSKKALSYVVDVTYKNTEKEPKIKGAKPLKTDGFNSLGKVRRMQGDVFFIRGEKDKLMKQTFGQHFVTSKYKTQEEREAHLMTIPGGHKDMESHMTEKHWSRLAEYLHEGGFILNDDWKSFINPAENDEGILDTFDDEFSD